MDRVSVAEAAHRLGISQDAVYKRIKRGTIPWEKGEDDKTYVWIDEVDRSTDRARQIYRPPFRIV
jgi:predicted DNA-binding transcriptional regulator AlpA